MYDELVKSLRQCAEASCAGCKNDLVQIGCRGLLQHEAADAIEKLSKPKWIPVTERLPEAGERVLCYCRANICEVMKMRTDGDWVYDTNHIYMRSFVTHWMPLPQPQKKEEGET